MRMRHIGNFLAEMRVLLKDEKRFKDRYCEVNHIQSREHIVAQEAGETSYLKRGMVMEIDSQKEDLF